MEAQKGWISREGLTGGQWSRPAVRAQGPGTSLPQLTEGVLSCLLVTPWVAAQVDDGIWAQFLPSWSSQPGRWGLVGCGHREWNKGTDVSSRKDNVTKDAAGDILTFHRISMSLSWKDPQVMTCGFPQSQESSQTCYYTPLGTGCLLPSEAIMLYGDRRRDSCLPTQPQSPGAGDPLEKGLDQCEMWMRPGVRETGRGQPGCYGIEWGLIQTIHRAPTVCQAPF